MAGKNYRVRISRGDQQFEAEGDKRFVLEMIKRFSAFNLSSAEPDDSALDVSGGSLAKGSAIKHLSLREFIQRLRLKKHTDIALAFGYYLEHYSDLKEFTPADVDNCYYEAKMEKSNTSQAIIQNIRRGRMMQSKTSAKGSKKRYTLTATGEQFIDGKLNDRGK